MNKWELRKQFNLDYITEMVKYAERKNKDRDSNEYKEALTEWVQEYLDEYRKNWEEINGSLEDECQTKNTKQ